MIRKSIEPGTIVWHAEHGFGKFKSWSKLYKDIALVDYELGIYMRSRKELTEIEPEKQEFDPPI